MGGGSCPSHQGEVRSDSRNTQDQPLLFPSPQCSQLLPQSLLLRVHMALPLAVWSCIFSLVSATWSSSHRGLWNHTGPLKSPQLIGWVCCTPSCDEGSCSQSGGLCTLRDRVWVLDSCWWSIPQGIWWSLGPSLPRVSGVVNLYLPSPEVPVHTSSLETYRELQVLRYSSAASLHPNRSRWGGSATENAAWVASSPNLASSVPFRSALSVSFLLKPSGCEIWDRLVKPGSAADLRLQLGLFVSKQLNLKSSSFLKNTSYQGPKGQSWNNLSNKINNESSGLIA